MKTAKRLLAVLLSVLMLAGMLTIATTAVSAAETESEAAGATFYGTGTVKVGETKYLNYYDFYSLHVPIKKIVPRCYNGTGAISATQYGYGALVTGVRAGTATVVLEVQLESRTDYVECDITVTGSTTALPKGPSNVTMKNTATGLQVTWSKPSGAAKYIFYYKKAGSSSWNSTVTPNTTMMMYTGVSGQKYSVQVQSVTSNNVAGYYSAVKTAMYLDQPSITSLTTTGTANTLKWSSIGGATKYQIAKAVKGSNNYSYYTTSSTSYTDYNITRGKAYTYQVKAMNTSGSTTYNSAWSGSKSVNSAVQLPAPSTVTLSNKSNGIRAEWSKVSGAAKYIVYYKRDGASSWSSVTTKNNYYPILNTSGGTKYCVQVQAVDSSGYAGKYSSVKKLTFVGRPSISSLSNQKDHVHLTWSSAPGAWKYQVAKATAGSKSYTYYTVYGTSFDDYENFDGVSYTYQVRAINTASDTAYGQWSTSKTITTLSWPVAYVNNRSNGIRFEWNPISGAAKYRVYYKKDSASSWTTTETKNNYFAFTNAVRGQVYNFQVQAIAANGNTGAYSNKWTITYYPNTNESKPETTVLNRDGGVRFYWSSVKNAERYRVYYGKTTDSYWTTLYTTNPNYYFTNLTEGSAYDFMVAPIINGVEGTRSDIETLTFKRQ